MRERVIATVLGILLLVLAVVGVRSAVQTLPLTAAAGSDTAWYVHLVQADVELRADNVTAALHHWRDAYAAAMASRRSEGVVEVGDFHRRLAGRPGVAESARVRARECYLTALLRARGEGSVDGVLRATEGFLAIGDEDMVERGLGIARELARRDPDPQARARIERLAARAARSAAASRSATGPSGR